MDWARNSSHVWSLPFDGNGAVPMNAQLESEIVGLLEAKGPMKAVEVVEIMVEEEHGTPIELGRALSRLIDRGRVRPDDRFQLIVVAPRPS